MARSSLLFLCAALISSVSSAQTGANVPADTALSVVAYVEARAAAAETARATLNRYREASRARWIGRVEFFEQIGRPGHFAIVETWRDQAAFDARDDSAHRQLLDELEAIRVSGYDQRLYKTLTTAPAVASTDSGTVSCHCARRRRAQLASTGVARTLGGGQPAGSR